MAIGFACVAVGVPNTSMSRCLLRTATEDNLRRVIDHNLTALENLVAYAISENIGLMRISSDLIPLATHDKMHLNWQDEEKERLQAIGSMIKQAGLRVSMHPGQYTVLNSIKADVVTSAIEDLAYHALVLDSMHLDSTHKIILHIGGMYGSKEEAMERFVKQYDSLSQGIKSRLIIENDDKIYTVEDVLALSKRCHIPVVFDTLHHAVNPPYQQKTLEEWVLICGMTWKTEDGRQKIHYSEQKINGKPGSHSETIGWERFIDFYKTLQNPVPDIMLEVKDKNLSAIKCQNVVLNVKAVALESEWKKYKYFALSQSKAVYDSCRQLLKDKDANCGRSFYSLIEVLYDLPENKGAQVNAAEHVWGYFKKVATEKEKKRFEHVLTAYKNDQMSLKAVKSFLYKLANHYDSKYLLNQLYFYI